MTLRGTTSFKIAAAFCCILALGACSKKSTPVLGGAEDGLIGGPGGASAPGSAQDFAANVGDRVYFLVDQTTLTTEAQETLRRQAAWLKQYPDVSIQVEGHADERGTREYNISLSARRATAPASFCSPKASRPAGFRPLPMARSGPLRFATPSSAGHKIAVL